MSANTSAPGLANPTPAKARHAACQLACVALLTLAAGTAGCATPAPAAAPAARVASAAAPATPSEWPAWLRQRVAEHQRLPVANPPREIWAGQHAGQPTYYEPPTCCDIPGTLYDAQGRRLCLPTGGITGRGDGRCPDADLDALQQRLVWRDPRAPR